MEVGNFIVIQGPSFKLFRKTFLYFFFILKGNCSLSVSTCIFITSYIIPCVKFLFLKLPLVWDNILLHLLSNSSCLLKGFYLGSFINLLNK
jgi:hypothetical protein